MNARVTPKAPPRASNRRRRSRVLIFAPAYLPLLGGAELAVKELTDRLGGWDFDLFCPRLRPELARRETIANVTVHRSGFGTKADKYLLPLLGTARALRVASRHEVACVWAVMASYGGLAALAYTWVRPRTRLLLTLQEGDPLERYSERAGRFAALHRNIFRRANAVQAISCFLASWASEMGFRGTPRVIPNGVDLARFHPRGGARQRAQVRRSLGFGDRDLVLVTTSRLSAKNGVDDLIRSLAAMRSHVKTLVVGDGEERTVLEQLVTSEGLRSRVVFAGERLHAEIPQLLHASDIFVRPSLSEGLGTAFLEAMACGLPVVGTPVGGIPDFLTDGVTGLFCRPRNPLSIAHAVDRIEREPGLRDRLATHAAALVRARYCWEGIAGEMAGLLDELADSAGVESPGAS